MTSEAGVGKTAGEKETWNVTIRVGLERRREGGPAHLGMLQTCCLYLLELQVHGCHTERHIRGYYMTVHISIFMTGVLGQCSLQNTVNTLPKA